MSHTVKFLEPHQLGYLRRPGLDEGKYGEAWEKPNGELYMHDKRTGRFVIACYIPGPIGGYNG